MRICLLMQREPFDDILAATLQRFWRQMHDQCVDVRWIWKPTSRRTPDHSIDLLCNIYLNAIFPASTGNGALEPIRREFSRSVSRWRTPIQKAYCRLALSPKLAHWFTHAVLRVSPPLASVTHQVIIPGNHKIRILERNNECSYGVLKHGFSWDRFQNEITSRRLAESLRIPVPKVLNTDHAGTWFQESYVNGTPLNRVSQNRKVKAIADRAHAELARLADETTEETRFGPYVSSLAEQIAKHLDQNHLLDEQQRNQLKTAVEQLSSAIDRCRSQTLLTARCHGDFQPANILVNNDNFWIIDWEYSTRRQRAYDALVFHCQTRRGHGLASRLRRFVDTCPPDALLRFNSSFASLEERRLFATILLLEELELRLAENANPCFTRLDDGLRWLTDDIQHWTAER